MPPIDWLILAWIAAGAAGLMLLLWIIHRPIGNAGIVDVGWAFSLGGAAVTCAVMADGALVHRVIIGTLGGAWGLRLAMHLLLDRVIGAPEDGRYQMLRQRLGSRFTVAMLPFFQAQALLVVILSVPFLLAAENPAPGLGIADILGAAMWIVGILGEAVADQQLKSFKRRPDSSGRTCRVGLWRYSRHPNYFFEWIIWCGYATLALGYWPVGLLGLTAPALMLLFILKITGIPPTEARALASRGEDYRRYQRTTSPFFPWPPKEEPA